MKLYKITLALILGVGTLASCNDKLELTNPNQQTTGSFGYTDSDLEECVIAAYNHTRMEGSYARVGYTIDVCRGDEVWNSSQVWYMPFDDLNDAVDAGDEPIGEWSWREWFYTLNVCNFILSRTGEDDDSGLTTTTSRIKGQALFLRGLCYYNLTGYYQNPPIITDYNSYSTLDGLYCKNYQETAGEDPNIQYDAALDLCESDFKRAMSLLPSKNEGGEWASGRANSGAAAGYYARTLMVRHKYSEALAVLKDIINGTYGTYKLMANYGDNFREGSPYENNDESLYEVQFLDKDQQGTDDEWTPVNTSAYATQGSAVESNYAPGNMGGWADLSASPWLYNLFKAERTTSGSLDPRLYWTIGTYEPEWEGYEFGNVAYTQAMSESTPVVTNNNYGGLPIAKWTHFRTGEYESVVTGLHDGINLRLMRYSDVLLRAAECENEVNGVTDQAIEWINQVRRRAELADLKKADFASKDALFEQIANVERPKEFGCEFGRGLDLIRWGFFYSSDRRQQLLEHGAFNICLDNTVKDPVDVTDCYKSTYQQYQDGHEFLPIYQWLLNNNANLTGNSANNSKSNSSYFTSNGWTVHPVVK